MWLAQMWGHSGCVLLYIALALVGGSCASTGKIKTSLWVDPTSADGTRATQVEFIQEPGGTHNLIFTVTPSGSIVRTDIAKSTWERQSMTTAAVNPKPGSAHYGLPELPVAGEQCETTAGGSLECDGRTALCNMEFSPPMCEERCFDTPTIKGTQIKRKDNYYCDYGSEKPKLPDGGLVAPPTLPLPGEACVLSHVEEARHRRRKTCSGADCKVKSGCFVAARCNLKSSRCEEICHNTNKRKASQIPLKGGWCEYGTDKVMMKSLTTGQIGSRCTASGSCVSGAFCNVRTHVCFESCVATATTSSRGIRRKQSFYCDYGDESPLTDLEVSGAGNSELLGKGCSETIKCGTHQFCHPSERICYERCYLTNKGGMEDRSESRGVKCDYKGETPVVRAPLVFNSKKTKKLEMKRLCPSGAMKGRLPCNQGRILCEDVYSECGELEDGVGVRIKCRAMGCALKMEDEKATSVYRVDPHPSKHHWNKIFITGLRNVNWVTNDAGETYKKSKSEFTLRGFKWHPFQPWAIAYEANLECLRERKYRCYGTLVASKDGGYSWTRILENVKYPNFAWVAQGTFGKAWSERADLLAVQHSKDRGPKRSWDPALNLVYSVGFFEEKEISVLVPQGNNFAIIDTYIFVAVATTKTQVNLVVSTNNAASFTAVKMPVDVKERSYGILETGEQACFVVVRGGALDAKYGSLYLSDEAGTSMALSLDQMHYERGRLADIVKVQGLDGVYLVNTVKDSDSLDLRLQDARDQTSGAQQAQLQTRISFDKGSTWQPLTPPARDSSGKRYHCSGKCHLHLMFRGNPRGYSPVFSASTGTGLLMGVGVVAPYLIEELSPDEVSTFFSRDAGHTWAEVQKGPCTYSFSNHGGLLVLAAQQQSSTTVSYSWNQGAHWSYLALGSPMQVTSIVTDTDAASLNVLAIGHTKETKLAAVSLDFTTLHQRECKGADTPDESSSDYEQWSPRSKDFGDVECVLGRSVSYTRRKQSAECYNPQDHDRRITQRNCECVQTDFECDAGFQRSRDESSCIVQPPEGTTEKSVAVELRADMLQLSKDPGLTDAMCEKYQDKIELYVETGWRRIPGDTCVGGTSLAPQVVQCTRLSVGMGSVFQTTFLVVVGIGAGYFLYSSSYVQDWIASRKIGSVRYSAVGGLETPESIFELDCEDS